MMRAALRDRLLYAGGYTTFFLIAFSISAYLTFPYDRLRDLIIERLSRSGDATSGDAMTVKIGELQPSWLTGVVIDDIEVVRSTRDNPEPATLRLDSVTLRASLLALLLGNTKGTATATLGDGTLDAAYAQSGDSQQIDAELDAIDVHALGLGPWLGVPLAGTASGTINLTLEQDPTKSTGDVALKIDGLRVGDGKAKIKIPGMAGGMTLEEIDAGALDAAFNLHDGLAEVERFAASGRDLKVNGSGSVRLAAPMRHSRLDVLLELKFSDTYKNRSDRTKSLFELVGMQSEWRRATAPDGTLRMHLGGSVQALRATAASGGAGRALRTKKKPKTATPAEVTE